MSVRRQKDLLRLGLCSAILFTLTGQSGAQKAPSTKGTRALEALQELLHEPNPVTREKGVERLLRVYGKDARLWETCVAQCKLRVRKGGKEEKSLSASSLHELRPRLWTGKKGGLIETEVLLYLPKGYSEEHRIPLLLAMHGSGSNARAQIGQWIRYADEASLAVICATDSGPNTGYRYSEAERQSQLSLLRFAKLRLPIDPDRVFLGGTSRGGHMTWDLATRYSDLWCGLAPLIGGPRLDTRNGQNNLRFLANLLELPIRDLQGELDDPALLWNLRYAFAWFSDQKAQQKEFVTFPKLGHAYDLAKRPWKDWFTASRRNPLPSEFRLSATRLDQARKHWLRILAFDKKTVKDAARIQVAPAQWKRLDAGGKKSFFAKAARKQCAHVVAKYGPRGGKLAFTLKSTGVKKLRLLLPRSLLPEDKVEKLKRGAKKSRRKPKKLVVKWNGRTRVLPARFDAKIYLMDFVERLDARTAPLGVIDL